MVAGWWPGRSCCWSSRSHSYSSLRSATRALSQGEWSHHASFCRDVDFRLGLGSNHYIVLWCIFNFLFFGSSWTEGGFSWFFLKGSTWATFICVIGRCVSNSDDGHRHVCQKALKKVSRRLVSFAYDWGVWSFRIWSTDSSNCKGSYGTWRITTKTVTSGCKHGVVEVRLPSSTSGIWSRAASRSLENACRGSAGIQFRDVGEWADRI